MNHQNHEETFKYVFSSIFNNLLYAGQENEHIKTAKWDRTVYIDNKGISPFAFSLKKKDIKALIQSGFEGVENYIERAKNKFHHEGEKYI